MEVKFFRTINSIIYLSDITSSVTCEKKECTVSLYVTKIFSRKFPGVIILWRDEQIFVFL